MVQINRRDFAKGAMGLFGWGMFAGGFGGVLAARFGQRPQHLGHHLRSQSLSGGASDQAGNSAVQLFSEGKHHIPGGLADGTLGPFDFPVGIGFRPGAD